MADKLSEKVDFNFIRYANCWEDADVLLQALHVKENAHVLSIASAGDNSFSFLSINNVKVYAVDLNPVQIYLCEFKKTAIQYLRHDEYLQLMGFVACADRIKIYNSIKNYLPASTLQWAEGMQSQIESGIVLAGKFEKYFAKFRKFVLPFVFAKQTVAEIFTPKVAVEQMELYNKKINNWRWRFLFKLFFSKWLMGKLGRDPQFLAQVEIPVGEFIFQQAQNHMISVACQKNYLLYFIFTGKFHTTYLPHYIRKENYNAIQANIKNITFAVADVQEALIQHPKQFTHANLSNIFEYMNAASFAEVALHLHQYMQPNAKLAYWNLMVPRVLHEAIPNQFEKASGVYTKIDNGFFYRNFYVTQTK